MHCPFRVSLKRHQKGGLWHLNIPSGVQHNHGRQRLVTIAKSCAFTPEMIDLIKRGLLTALNPTQIYHTLQDRYPDNDFVMQDIYNAIHKIRSTELGNWTSTQALLDCLDADVNWQETYSTFESGQLQRLYLQPHLGAAYTRCWGSSIIIDNTYKTNR